MKYLGSLIRRSSAGPAFTSDPESDLEVKKTKGTAVETGPLEFLQAIAAPENTSTSVASMPLNMKANSASTPLASMLPDYEDTSAVVPVQKTILEIGETAAGDAHKSPLFEESGDVSRMAGLKISEPVRSSEDWLTTKWLST